MSYYIVVVVVRFRNGHFIYLRIAKEAVTGREAEQAAVADVEEITPDDVQVFAVKTTEVEIR